jgi:hypothetical protein
VVKQLKLPREEVKSSSSMAGLVHGAGLSESDEVGIFRWSPEDKVNG